MKKRDTGRRSKTNEADARDADHGLSAGRDDEGGGWEDIDPGFSLPTPPGDAIDPRFAARLGDPSRVDPGFVLPPPGRRRRAGEL